MKWEIVTLYFVNMLHLTFELSKCKSKTNQRIDIVNQN